VHIGRQRRLRHFIATVSFIIGNLGCRSAPLPIISPGSNQHTPAAAGGTSTLLAAPVFSGTEPAPERAPEQASPPSSASTTAQPIESVPAKDYEKWLREANRRHQRKDYSGAVEAFKKALLARPDSAEALSELGWSAYFAHDLTLAERSTRAALKASPAGDNKLRGAAYYNLGVVLEELGRKSEATEAFASSFAARPSTAARQRLSKLDTSAAEAALAIRAAKLDGPLPTLSSICEGDITTCFIPGSEKYSDPSLTGPNALGSRGPYKSAHVVGNRSGPYGMHSLAIETASGWYVKGLFQSNMAVSGAWTGGGEIESLEYRDAIAGAPTEILLTYKYSGATGGSIDPSQYEESSNRSLIICGLSGEGAPACSEAITLELTEKKVESETAAYGLNFSFSPPNWLVVTHAEGTLPDSVRAQLGKRRIILP